MQMQMRQEQIMRMGDMKEESMTLLGGDTATPSGLKTNTNATSDSFYQQMIMSSKQLIEEMQKEVKESKNELSKLQKQDKLR